jgi:hypothetical protein
MENMEMYLRRKRREIALIACGASGPEPKSVAEVVTRKFQAGAALRGEQARGDWQLTETKWADWPQFRIGPFELEFNYQRADLSIRGPWVYEGPWKEIIWSDYTSCGMAAVTVLAAGLGQIYPGAAMSLRPDCYPETRELMTLCGRRFGLVPVFEAEPGGGRMVFLDSGVPVHFRVPDLTGCDLVVFDTTCFATSSGRIRAVVSRSRMANVPIILLRSHTKLDSLGIEYSRLGSVVVIVPTGASAERRRLTERLAEAMQTAIRLFGAAAVPEHLPPFAAGREWRALYCDRVARIVHNNRSAARALASSLQGRAKVRCYQHGLFLTLDLGAAWNEVMARGRAEDLADALRRSGLPVRHAGSFGFDFVVVDGYPAADDDRFVVRIGFADLPDETAAQVTAGITAWVAGVSGAQRRRVGTAELTAR